MGNNTGIEWTDATWNPVTGCTKVSQGCKHCYAERMFPRAYAASTAWDGTPRKFTDVATHPERLDYPLRWRRPKRIFVNSMSDLFHEHVPDDFILSVFNTMANAPQHTYQVLTKRPERMRAWVASIDSGKWPMWIFPWPLPNVWLGVSVEDQATADERIPLLLKTPAAVRWISAEPLLGPIDLDDMVVPDGGPGENHMSALDCDVAVDDDEEYHGATLDWVVVGGESGLGARPMNPAWARSLRDQCRYARVPFLFKQWGQWAPCCSNEAHEASASEQLIGDTWMVKLRNKTDAGRELDGRLYDEYPTRERGETP